MSVYRTKTYIAADWDHDYDAVSQILDWNDDDYYSSFNFVNVHDFVQAKDDSLYCTIKRSLSKRMSMCKTFILIVGEHTNSITKGGCQNCRNYIKFFDLCTKGHSISTKSYIDYECESAINNNLDILVLYNSNRVQKELCPEIIRDVGVHIPMKKDGAYLFAMVRNGLKKTEGQ